MKRTISVWWLLAVLLVAWAPYLMGQMSVSGPLAWLDNGTNVFLTNNTRNVGVKTATPASSFHVSETGTGAVRGMLSAQYTTNTQGAQIIGRKARGTEASPTTLVSGDALFNLIAHGYDGTNYLEAAAIEMQSRGTIAATRVPTRMIFSTSTDATPSVLTSLLELYLGNAISVFGVTPVTRAAAYTQTYATATKTHSNFTSADLATTAATQTSPWGFALQAQAENIATQFNLLRADLANLKQIVNSIIDDQQAYGWAQ